MLVARRSIRRENLHPVVSANDINCKLGRTIRRPSYDRKLYGQKAGLQSHAQRRQAGNDPSEYWSRGHGIHFRIDQLVPLRVNARPERCWKSTRDLIFSDCVALKTRPPKPPMAV